ncbi:hypothetical protein FIV42_09315 [Persicimonas caeni]|uniref:DUF4382 domain-containing protein n=1 Tax=Persicimonas caeni TaxID=2292766 RepID=A0A4Y6PRF4_PERCE|nr:hypothetical protein [Persicimonas caeni]QDG50924.1 hypothetical protein FIV42_09315 [Persicimonas caeni]QED32145.1 hypothetical protein FRD00_09310 [Persicimonas caeni]
MKRITLHILLLVALLVPSCVGTDVGNPQDEQANVELEVAGYTETRSGALTLEDGLRIDTAWIVLSQFRFRSVDDCEDETLPYDVTDPVVVDLLADQPTYDAPLFTKPAGDYCKLDVGFSQVDADALPAGAPGELAGLSLFVEGARADGVEFRIEADLDDKFHLSGVLEDFELVGDQHLIVGFALDEWINESQLDNVSDQDPIVISSEENPEMMGSFKASIKRSARLFRDENNNRRLDANEKGQAIASSAQQNNPGTNGQNQNNGNNQSDDAGQP